jgi:hypothetical protein
VPAPEGLVVTAGADAAGRIAEFRAERGVLRRERVVVAAVDPDRHPPQHVQRGGRLYVGRIAEAHRAGRVAARSVQHQHYRQRTGYPRRSHRLQPRPPAPPVSKLSTRTGE